MRREATRALTTICSVEDSREGSPGPWLTRVSSLTQQLALACPLGRKCQERQNDFHRVKSSLEVMLL